jgi:hypothetical protein
MNKKLITEIGKIQRIIFNKEIITEAMAPAFLKRVFSLADDVVKSFMKTDLTDDIINSIRKGEQLSDEAVERLFKNTDFNKLSAIIIDNKLLGTAFDDQVDKVVELIRKNPKQQELILQKLDDTIDNLAFLSEGPEELKTAIKKRTKAKVTESLVEGIDDVFDTIDNQLQPLDNIVQNMDPKSVGKIRWSQFWNGRLSDYDIIRQRAAKSGSYIELFDDKQIKDILERAANTAKSLDPKLQDELNKVFKQPWWKSLNIWQKTAFVLAFVGAGPYVVVVLGWLFLQRLTGTGDVKWLWNFLSGVEAQTEGKITELSNSNIESWFAQAYPASYVDSKNFNSNFTITINNTKTRAVIEANDGSQEWEVSLSENKIQEIK